MCEAVALRQGCCTAVYVCCRVCRLHPHLTHYHLSGVNPVYSGSALCSLSLRLLCTQHYEGHKLSHCCICSCRDLDFGLHPCFSSILPFDCCFVSAIFKIRRENLQSVYMETIAVRLGFRPFRTTSGSSRPRTR